MHRKKRKGRRFILRATKKEKQFNTGGGGHEEGEAEHTTDGVRRFLGGALASRGAGRRLWLGGLRGLHRPGLRRH